MDPILLAATRDTEFWLRQCAQIRKKDGSIEPAGAIRPNKLQLRVLEYYRECQLAGKPCLIMILKPRQKGASTIAEAVIYHHMRTHPGLNGALMGDIAATSDKVFEMFRRYYESDTYPWGQGPIDEDQNLADEITLPNGSKWYKETAGSTNAGRSGTVQVAHMEEVAFFQTTVSKDPTTAFLGSFYKDGPMSLGFATSTANGASGWFYDTWNTKDNAWHKIFAAWFEFDDSSRKFESDEARAAFERSLNEDEINERTLYNVTLEQLNWRRHIINTDYRGDVAKFRQEMPSNEEECFLLTSRPRFDPVAVKNMQALAATNDYRQRGNLVIQGDKSSIWIPDAQGSIHRMEEPIIGCRYLVSADTCTGEDQQISGHTADPDWHSVQVWRQGYFDQGAGVQRNPMLVAYHKSQVDTDELAEIIASLSFYYGKCLAVPEVNGMGGLHVVKLLVAYGVPVFRRKPHTNHTKKKTEEEEMEAFGWLTDTLTRKWIIDALVPLVRTERLDIFYREILDQFRTFVITDQGKAEAMPGKHDDDVMAAAIALFNMGAATEYRLRQARGVDLMRLARDPRYLAPDGFRRVIARPNR
jgi:hypothetical protein